MTEEQAIVDRLLATTGVTTLVGTRIYQLRLPQDATFPAVRVQLVDETQDYHLRGGSKTRRTRLQVDSFAQEASGVDPYAAVGSLAAAIETALSGQIFADGSMQITGAFLQTRQPLYESEELRLVRMLQEWIVWSQRA